MATWYINNMIEHHAKEETSVKKQINLKQGCIPTIEEMQSQGLSSKIFCKLTYMEVFCIILINCLNCSSVQQITICKK